MFPYAAKLDSNNLVLSGVDWHMVMEIAIELMADQFTALKDGDGTYTLTFPVTDVIKEEYRGLFHQLKRKNSDGKGPKGSDPNGKPPRPTNPRGSGGKVVEFQNTMAVAA